MSSLKKTMESSLGRETASSKLVVTLLQEYYMFYGFNSHAFKCSSALLGTGHCG